MISQQESAWITYCILLGIALIALGVRCRDNWLLLPFVVFTLLALIALVVPLSHPSQSRTILIWMDRSTVINHLPIVSLFLFAGIVETQIIYMQNRRGTPEYPAQKRPASFWINLAFVITFTLLVVALICIRMLRDDNLRSTRYQVAACISTLAALAVVHAIFTLVTVRGGPQRHLCFLWVLPILLTIAMVGMSLEAWILFVFIGSHRVHHFSMVSWIMLESFLVYLPIFVILLLCLCIHRIHNLGRDFHMSEHRTTRYMRDHPQHPSSL